MEFKDGTNVYTSDGKQAGGLHRIVINPETMEVTQIVIQKGVLFKDDKVISVRDVATTSPEKVVLYITAEDVNEMPPLFINQHVPIGDRANREGNTDMYWNPTKDRPVVMLKKRTISEDLVALKEGARVTSEEGLHVGSMESVLTDPETRKVTHFILSQGLLLKVRRFLPVEWVKLLDDDEVRLSIEAQEIDGLPIVHAEESFINVP